MMEDFVTHIDFGLILREGEMMNEKHVVVNKETGKRVRNVALDELYMQCTTPNTLAFFNVKSAEKLTSPQPLKDMTTATWTNNLGFPVQGVDNNVLSVDRNHIYRKVPVLATSDDLGTIKLYNYPCVSSGCAEKTYLAHSSAITNIFFTFDDGCLVSTGGSDRTICVWKTDIIEEARELDAAGVGDSETEGTGIDGDADADEEDDELYAGGRGGGDEFMAVKPYLGAIKEPSTWKEPEDCGEEPANQLSMSFVYGSR